jgi:hypothetical protein
MLIRRDVSVGQASLPAGSGGFQPGLKLLHPLVMLFSEFELFFGVREQTVGYDIVSKFV